MNYKRTSQGTCKIETAFPEITSLPCFLRYVMTFSFRVTCCARPVDGTKSSLWAMRRRALA